MKNFFAFLITGFGLFITSHAMHREEPSADKLLISATREANAEDIDSLLDDPLITKNLKPQAITEAIKKIITRGNMNDCPEPKFTPKDRVALIKKILLTSSVIELMDAQKVGEIFDCATTFGPSSIVQALLDTPCFLKKVDKERACWALKSHFQIDILSKKEYNLVEKDSSNVLRVLLSYQYIHDFIDALTALRILQNTMIRQNAHSIAVIFENDKLLEKIAPEDICKCARWMGGIEDANTVRQLLGNQNFIKYLSQEGFNECYQRARTDDVKALLKPYVSECIIL